MSEGVTGPPAACRGLGCTEIFKKNVREATGDTSLHRHRTNACHRNAPGLARTALRHGVQNLNLERRALCIEGQRFSLVACQM